jgi:hypothetical protein
MQFMNFQGPNFTLEVPTNWVISSSVNFQAIFLGPGDQPVRPNLVLAIRALETGVTYTDVAASARETQEKEYPEYRVLEEKDYGESGGSVLIRRYEWLNPANNVRVVQVQAFIVVGQLLFTMTATRAAELEPAQQQENDKIFDHIIQSFRLVTPA